MLTVHLTPDEALSLVAGPVVEGRDVSYAESEAYGKVWGALGGVEEAWGHYSHPDDEPKSGEISERLALALKAVSDEEGDYYGLDNLATWPDGFMEMAKRVLGHLAEKEDGPDGV